MARCYSGELGDLSGTVGKVVFCRRGSVTYVRARSFKLKDRGSKLQLFYRERMRRVVTFYGVIRQTLLARVWRVAGWKKGRSPYNLFIQANMRAVNGDAWFYDLVCFSGGNLFVPPGMEARREEDRIRLTWKNEEVLKDERVEDELWCVVMTEDGTFRVVCPEETKGIRGNGSAEIELTEEEGKGVHLYCFFGSKDRENFSENVYFKL